MAAPCTAEALSPAISMADQLERGVGRSHPCSVVDFTRRVTAWVAACNRPASSGIDVWDEGPIGHSRRLVGYVSYLSRAVHGMVPLWKDMTRT